MKKRNSVFNLFSSVPHLWLIFSLIFATTLSAQTRANPKFNALPSYKTRYYVIRTDVAGDDLREAELRMTKMAEEYSARTKDFSGVVRGQFPFYLFKNETDYLDAGGMEGSAGLYNTGNRTLMAVAGEPLSPRVWHVVQHEGFHQFAASTIGSLPTWINEGLAEYFGEAIFTGDGFVTGVIPDFRLKRIQKTLKADDFKPFKQIMLMPLGEWNEGLSVANYDQAWSMVHFLVHAQDGKYQDGFTKFILAVNAHEPWEKAWLKNLGDASEFERRWKSFWEDLPENPTDDVYSKATTQILTSVLARQTLQKQKFTNFPEFLAAAKSGKMKFEDRHWLPASLVARAVAEVELIQKDGGELRITPGKLPTILCTTKAKSWVGKFVLQNNRVTEVIVEAKK